MAQKIDEKGIKERIVNRIDVDSQLKKIYYDANPVISLPSAQRNFEVASQTQQSDDDKELLRKLLNKPLVDDVTGTTPGTREIHTNTAPQEIQPNRSQNGAIISNEDKVEPLLDISMTSIKYKVNDFKNVVDTEFEEFTAASTTKTTEELLQELDTLKAERDLYIEQLNAPIVLVPQLADPTTIPNTSAPIIAKLPEPTPEEIRAKALARFRKIF